MHGENEIWYDGGRGLVHSRSLLGGVVQHEDVYEPKELPAELVALGREYRQALESGSARVAGEGVIDGEGVYWITFRSETLPDVADGKLHEWAQQVAVSRDTFKPVATRETRDGEPGPLGTKQRVLELETLPAGQGDFTASEADSIDGMAFKEGREAISLDQAPQVLGRTPLWLGREHRGLLLAESSRKTTSIGRREEIRRQDGVFTYGPTVWEEEQTGVILFYGALGDEPSTYRKDLAPRYDQPHLAITQTTHRSPFLRGAGNYVPPDGSVLIAAGGRTGVLRAGDVYVSIESSSEELVLSAARALEPMPR